MAGLIGNTGNLLSYVKDRQARFDAYALKCDKAEKESAWNPRSAWKDGSADHRLVPAPNTGWMAGVRGRITEYYRNMTKIAIRRLPRPFRSGRGHSPV